MMRENTTQPYIDAHDKGWERFVKEWYRRRRHIPPSNWECYAGGFADGVKYGRAHPTPAEDYAKTPAARHE